MARTIEKLSPAAVQRASKPGLYGDGAGLWLHVGKATKGKGDKGKLVNKSWILRFMVDGRARSMGLGPLHTVSLAEARERARTMRRMLLDGIDPIEAKHTARRARKLEAAKSIVFKACAEHYIAANSAAWSNAKHAAQWPASLEAYAYPLIGGLPVGGIDTGHVVKVLEPIWTKKPETASRVRGRIEIVLDYAKARGWREGENPARWRGHLENVLPRRSKVAAVEHHAALPYVEVGEFMVALRKQNGTAARALEYTILTAARTGEVIGATWGEIDLQSKVWTIPAERMKAGREHRVPLSDAALAVLRGAHKLRTDASAFVFPGGKAGEPLGTMTLLRVLQRMGRTGLTVHGFRSTFRDWCSERTNCQAEVAEMALAHTVGDKVEQAYRRGDLLDRRRRLMADWAAWCASPFVEGAGNVTALHGGGAA